MEGCPTGAVLPSAIVATCTLVSLLIALFTHRARRKVKKEKESKYNKGKK